MYYVKTYWLAVLFTVLFAAESRAGEGLKQFIETPCLSTAGIGVLVKEIHSGEVVMDHRSAKALIPGSTMKLVTTAAALEMLGSDFRFETPLEYSGAIDAAGTLNGNVYIMASGDPTIGSEVFDDHRFIDRWVDAVKRAGIKRINGSVIANVSRYDGEATPPDWTWQNMGNYFAAGVYGLSLFDNMYRLTFRTGSPGSTPAITGTTPAMPELVFHNFLKAGAEGSDADDGYLHGAPFSNERTITGVIPPFKNAFTIKGDMPNPPLKLAGYFTAKLDSAGISVAGTPLVETAGFTHHVTVFTHKSPPLIDIINNTNHVSNNLFAEHLFKRLALTHDSVATREGAIEAIRNFWQQQQLDVSELFMMDGCGLSPVDAVSPKFLVQLLSYMRTKSANSTLFFTSLPTSGGDGTLKTFLNKTSLAGKVHAKSGSIRRVLCYAGYVESGKKEYVFAIMVNNFKGSYSDVKKAIEKLLLHLR